MEINQDALFAKKESKVLKVTEQKLEVAKEIPSNYIEVNLISGDKFSIPVLHFRNYTMEEILHIGSSTDENFLYNLIYKGLNKMCYEDFDCADLTVNHVIQIVLTVYKNFWGNKLLRKPYVIDESKEVEKSNVGFVDIDISKLDALFLPEEFKEPFTIVDKKFNTKVKLGIQKLKHLFFAETFVKDFYKEEKSDYDTIEQKIKLKKELEASPDEAVRESSRTIVVTNEEKEALDNFKSEKAMLYARVLQSQIIYAIDGKEITTIEEKIDAYKNKIDATTWKFYNELLTKYQFGINSTYTFKVDGKKLSRRFSFRLLEFLPTLESKSSERYDVCFDD